MTSPSLLLEALAPPEGTPPVAADDRHALLEELRSAERDLASAESAALGRPSQRGPVGRHQERVLALRARLRQVEATRDAA